MLMLGVLLFSCKDDAGSDSAPKQIINVSLAGTAPFTAIPGDVLTYDMTLTSAEPIVGAITFLNDQEVAGSRQTFPEGATEAAYSFTYTVQPAQTGSTIDFVVHIEGSTGRIVKVEYPVYIVAAPAQIGITIPADAPAEMTAGVETTFDIAVTSALPLHQIVLLLGGVEVEGSKVTTFTDPNSCTYTFAYTPTAGQTGQTLAFLLQVMDSNGAIVTEPYSATVKAPVSDEVDSYYGKVMGYHRYVAQEGEGHFLDAETGTVYKTTGAGAADVCPLLDITFFFSGSGGQGFTISAPGNTNLNNIYNAATIGILGGNATTDIISAWSVRRNTYFKKLLLTEALTDSQFAALDTRQKLEDTYENSTFTAALFVGTGIAEGSCIAFLTESGLYGVIRIIDRATANTGKVTFDYKIQKPTP